MRPTVSIVINNYNYGRFLRQAIDSALAQTYPEVEVIVVDDGSTDDSRAVIASYGGRIRPVLKENGGQASAFNAGFAAARGEIVGFLDADDYYAPRAFERIAAIWSDEVRIVHHRLQEVDAAGRPLGFIPQEGEALDAGDVIPLLLAQGYYSAPPTSGLAYRREFLAQVFPVPEADYRICADAYLLLSTPFRGPVTALDETLAYYRRHGANSYRQAELRRDWQLGKLELKERRLAIHRVLIQRLAAEHGYPAPDVQAWADSGACFERLLLFKALPAERGRVRSQLGALLRKLGREASMPAGVRLRLVVLGLLVWLAPRSFLRHIYPNIFRA